MKIVSGLLALGLLAGASTEANAVVCARGVYRAGCATTHGAAVVHRAPAAVVVAPRCYINRYGRRVCA